MKPQNLYLKPIFLDYIPPNLESGCLYISIKFATATHKCACGCENEVVTPLSQADWKIIYDGKTITLHPSIGNWSFKCKSHYWVKQNRIAWAENWSPEKINKNRIFDRCQKDKYFQSEQVGKDKVTTPSRDMSAWQKLMKSLFG